MSRAVPLALAALHRAGLDIDYRLEVEDDDLMLAELGLSLPRGGKDLTILLVPVPHLSPVGPLRPHGKRSPPAPASTRPSSSGCAGS